MEGGDGSEATNHCEGATTRGEPASVQRRAKRASEARRARRGEADSGELVDREKLREDNFATHPGLNPSSPTDTGGSAQDLPCGMSAGIGLKVERSAAGYVVTALSERGGAKRSGVLEIGDLVASIDGVDVTASACALAPLVLGPEGSQLRLGYTRKPGGPTRFVMLTRGQEEERLAVRATQSPLAFHTDQPAHMNAEKQRASRPSTGGAGGHGGRGERSPGKLAATQRFATDFRSFVEPPFLHSGCPEPCPSPTQPLVRLRSDSTQRPRRWMGSRARMANKPYNHNPKPKSRAWRGGRLSGHRGVDAPRTSSPNLCSTARTLPELGRVWNFCVGHHPKKSRYVPG